MSGNPKPGIAVAGTFTLDSVIAVMSWWLEGEQTGRSVVAAPYGQVLEPLHGPGGVLLTNTGVNVLLLRLEDLFRGTERPVPGGEPTGADALLEGLVSALVAAPAQCSATWLIAILPPSPKVLAEPSVAEWIRVGTGRIRRVTAQAPGMYFVELDKVPALYRVEEVHDEYAGVIGHLPYTDEYSAALATWLVRLATTTWTKPKKIIVLDCDNGADRDTVETSNGRC